VMHGLRPELLDRVRRFLTYDRGMFVAAGLGFLGMALLATLVYRYLKHGLRLETISHPAILGLLFVILAFQTFGFTLLVEMIRRLRPERRNAQT